LLVDAGWPGFEGRDAERIIAAAKKAIRRAFIETCAFVWVQWALPTVVMPVHERWTSCPNLLSKSGYWSRPVWLELGGGAQTRGTASKTVLNILKENDRFG
jgi:hypothetical protein